MKRLKSRNDFNKLSKCSQKTIGKYFIVVYLLDTDVFEPMVGITVSKKIGNAVVRNKTKRRIRACLQAYEAPTTKTNVICNIIALPAILNADWNMFKRDLTNCLDRVFYAI
ncbi:MAG: ribonuclease P protein component [Candidatus Cloacimonetes bacterium]|nr:ribonuclease P protein component [Candidatus Cloacimonadota bacterium]